MDFDQALDMTRKADEAKVAVLPQKPPAKQDEAGQGGRRRPAGAVQGDAYQFGSCVGKGLGLQRLNVAAGEPLLPVAECDAWAVPLRAVNR